MQQGLALPGEATLDKTSSQLRVNCRVRWRARWYQTASQESAGERAELLINKPHCCSSKRRHGERGVFTCDSGGATAGQLDSVEAASVPLQQLRALSCGEVPRPAGHNR